MSNWEFWSKSGFMLKRRFAFIFVSAVLCVIMIGCSGKNDSAEATPDEVSAVATVETGTTTEADGQINDEESVLKKEYKELLPNTYATYNGENGECGLARVEIHDDLTYKVYDSADELQSSGHIELKDNINGYKEENKNGLVENIPAAYLYEDGNDKEYLYLNLSRSNDKPRMSLTLFRWHENDEGSDMFLSPDSLAKIEKNMQQQYNESQDSTDEYYEDDYYEEDEDENEDSGKGKKRPASNLNAKK